MRLCIIDVTKSTRTPPQSSQSITALLLQLDASVRPGLTESDLRDLLEKCVCGIVTTGRAFDAHYCHAPKKMKLAESLLVGRRASGADTGSGYDTECDSLDEA